MKRKGLTIIFFSVMALAVTPRAMQHLRDYTAAAQHQVQVELLRFLLDFGAPATESQAAQPQPSAQTLACESKAQPEASRARVAAPAPAAAIAQNRTPEPVINSFKLTPVEISQNVGQPLEHMRYSYDLETSRHVFVKYAPRMEKFAPQPEAALAPYLNKLANSDYVKALLKSGKLKDRRAERALRKELNALARESGWSIASPNVRAERVIPVETIEPPSAPASKAERCEQDSMR